jgi:hypothetical protein
VIREGGDCAYRTRAFIVILREFDIRASKFVLYDDNGHPHHAVAGVQTPNGIEYVDLLYNLVHEDETGRALTLEELADRETLNSSVARAVAGGNQRAQRYPVQSYDFEDVRTINWNKTALLKYAYGGLALVLGDETARSIPRPYLSEEPALMVIVLCGGGAMMCLILIGAINRWGKEGFFRHGERRAAATVGRAA